MVPPNKRLCFKNIEYGKFKIYDSVFKNNKSIFIKITCYRVEKSLTKMMGFLSVKAAMCLIFNTVHNSHSLKLYGSWLSTKF